MTTSDLRKSVVSIIQIKRVVLETICDYTGLDPKIIKANDHLQKVHSIDDFTRAVIVSKVESHFDVSTREVAPFECLTTLDLIANSVDRAMSNMINNDIMALFVRCYRDATGIHDKEITMNLHIKRDLNLHSIAMMDIAEKLRELDLPVNDTRFCECMTVECVVSQLRSMIVQS